MTIQTLNRGQSLCVGRESDWGAWGEEQTETPVEAGGARGPITRLSRGREAGTSPGRGSRAQSASTRGHVGQDWRPRRPGARLAGRGAGARLSLGWGSSRQSQAGWWSILAPRGGRCAGAPFRSPTQPCSPPPLHSLHPPRGRLRETEAALAKGPRDQGHCSL